MKHHGRDCAGYRADEHHGGEEAVRHHLRAHLVSLLHDDHGDFRAWHHADRKKRGAREGQVAQSGNPVAERLASHRREKQDCAYADRTGQGVWRHGETDANEEKRRQEVVDRTEVGVEFDTVRVSAEDETGEKRADRFGESDQAGHRGNGDPKPRDKQHGFGFGLQTLEKARHGLFKILGKEETERTKDKKLDHEDAECLANNRRQSRVQALSTMRLQRGQYRE